MVQSQQRVEGKLSLHHHSDTIKSDDRKIQIIGGEGRRREKLR